MKNESLAAARQSFLIEAQCLQDAFDHIDPKQFAGAVEALAKAPRIAASACGHSGIACRHFAHLMCCIQRPAKFIPPGEALHGGLGFLQPGDVMLLASRGGKTAELFPILDYCKANNVKVISVTENVNSPIAAEADIVLKMYITRETDKYNCQGTTSNTVLNSIFDALQVSLIEETDYQIEQFAKVHPGGAVGERLNR
jgi:D-arabinose 5-phosphate isomerase GutQ